MTQPKHHVRIYHSEKDDVVPYPLNVDKLKNEWTDITFVPLKASTHGQAEREFYKMFIEGQ
jgi:hypothetical protein